MGICCVELLKSVSFCVLMSHGVAGGGLILLRNQLANKEVVWLVGFNLDNICEW